MVVQELHECDWENRMACCEDILQNIPANAVLLTSEEAHFHLSGCVNEQNLCYWAENNPKELHDRPLHSEHVTVWCAVVNFGVWSPQFFDDEEGQTVSVCGDVTNISGAKTHKP